MTPLPISVIIPTLDRRNRLARTIASVLRQEVTPAEVIVIDASVAPVSIDELVDLGRQLQVATEFIRIIPRVRGAAAQRNAGFARASQPFVLFMDDDIDLGPGCLDLLWRTLHSDGRVGACGVVNTNQHYHPPGRLMRRIYHLLGCP